jgi:uncharacterized protein
MSQAAKAQEPSMEEILASIRRIIADDEGPKSAPVSSTAAAAPPAPAQPSWPAAAETAAAPEPVPMSQDDIDTMLAGFEAPAAAPAPKAAVPAQEPSDVLD